MNRIAFFFLLLAAMFGLAVVVTWMAFGGTARSDAELMPPAESGESSGGPVTDRQK